MIKIERINPASTLGKMVAYVVKYDRVPLEVKDEVLKQLEAMGFAERIAELKANGAPKLTVECHVTRPDEKPKLGPHCDNQGLNTSQVALYVYPPGDEGGWANGDLVVYDSSGGFTSIHTIPTNAGWQAVAINDDVKHEPTPPTHGTRVCVAFHYGYE